MLDILNRDAMLDMQCNINKTVCIMFPPVSRRCVITNIPLLKINDKSIRYVNRFKYLGHMTVNYFYDDQDIERDP